MESMMIKDFRTITPGYRIKVGNNAIGAPSQYIEGVVMDIQYETSYNSFIIKYLIIEDSGKKRVIEVGRKEDISDVILDFWPDTTAGRVLYAQN
jgi:hypothetical protein